MKATKIKIDWTEVGRLLEAGCSGVEIAGYFGFSEETLYVRCEKELGMLFTAYKQEKRARGDSLLRAKQFQSAIKGNIPMQIFLGKNRLNQSDRVESKVEGEFTTTTKIILPSAETPPEEVDEG